MEERWKNVGRTMEERLEFYERLIKKSQEKLLKTHDWLLKSIKRDKLRNIKPFPEIIKVKNEVLYVIMFLNGADLYGETDEGEEEEEEERDEVLTEVLRKKKKAEEDPAGAGEERSSKKRKSN